MKKSNCLVVIPAHNEEETIREVVTRTLAYADVSVTDDGSRDGTAAILKAIQAECTAGKHKHALNVITHEKATHIPKGVQDGMRYGTAQGYEFIITMDAGLSHDPDAIPGFLTFDPSIDVVIGTRTETENVPLYRRLISFGAARLVNYALTPGWFNLLGPGIRDCTGGFRRYSRRAAGKVAEAELISKAFDFHMEALALCIRSGMTFGEVPITYVFSNSSFNGRVLKLAAKFGWHLLKTKGRAGGRTLTMRGVLLAFLAYYILAVSAAIWRYDWNPTAMIHFGHYYAEQNASYMPRGAVRFTANEEFGGNGYDGQIFYFFARTLLERGVWPEGFNNAYRAPRVGYPLLAAPFSLFGSWGVVAGMILVQLLFLGAATAALFRMLPADKRYLTFLYIASPFHLQAFSVLVSDSLVSSLLVLGLYFFRRKGELFPFWAADTAAERRTLRLGGITFWTTIPMAGRERAGVVAAWICFALALLTKESSLFLLFPLGLAALWRRDVARTATVALTLLPPVLWQFYLRKAHGMVPAEILGTFLSPLDGIRGVLSTALQMTAGKQWGALVKHSAKLILLLVLAGSVVVGVTQVRRRAVPYALAVLLTALSILVADYYYFWGIFENVGRMFTLLVPLSILLCAQMDEGTYPRGFKAFAAATLVLSLVVWARLAWLSPVFPSDTWQPYTGPAHSSHAPLLTPGK
ncbi:MAG: glycosyltransferase [Spirochaetia bacterium]|nr:glycosyltransferase [Spirochaetia bacterium]